MNDERNYEISTLSDRIASQTEAYVEMSNSQVRIIEQLAFTRDMVKELSQFQHERYNKFIAAIELNKQNLEIMMNKLEKYNQHFDNVKMNYDRLKYFMGALALIATVLGTLIATKIISISWFNH